MPAKSSSKNAKRANFFRPDAPLAPRLGQTFEMYETYLKSYALYTTFLKSSRQDFWGGVASKAAREPYEVPHVDVPLPMGEPKYQLVLEKTHGQFVPYEPAHQMSLAPDVRFSKSYLDTYCKDLKRGNNLRLSVIPLPDSSHPTIVTKQVVPKPPPVQAKVQPTTAQLEQKKANLVARRRRHRAARAARERVRVTQRLQQTTKVVDARFACEKVQNKFESWTKVVSKTSKKRQAKASARAAKSQEKEAPASRPPWYPLTQDAARALKARWDAPKS